MMFWEDLPFILGARIDDSEVLPHLEARPDAAGLHNPIGDISFSSPTVVATSDGFAVQYATHTDSPPAMGIYHVDPAWPDVPMQATDLAGGVASGGFVFAEGTTDSDKQAQGPIHLLIEHQPTLLSIDVSTALDGAEPSVARGGDRVLVAYRQGSQDEPKRIRVQAFDATTGSPVGPAASDLFPDEKHCDRPSVTFDGQNFWVAFRRADGGRADLLGVRVSPSGAVLESPFVISDDPEAELSTSIAANASGRILIAYSRFDRAAAGARVKVRWAHTQ
jgi:hypothetical protein